MANELKVSLTVTVANGSYKLDFNPGLKQITQDAIGSEEGVQIVGTSEEVVTVGDVTTLGWALFHNLDATNYVEVGPESSGALVGFIRLEAGEFCLLRLKPGITIRAQANTAAVKLRKIILQD